MEAFVGAVEMRQVEREHLDRRTEQLAQLGDARRRSSGSCGPPGASIDRARTGLRPRRFPAPPAGRRSRSPSATRSLRDRVGLGRRPSLPGPKQDGSGVGHAGRGRTRRSRRGRRGRGRSGLDGGARALELRAERRMLVGRRDGVGFGSPAVPLPCSEVVGDGWAHEHAEQWRGLILDRQPRAAGRARRSAKPGGSGSVPVRDRR